LGGTQAIVVLGAGRNGIGTLQFSGIANREKGDKAKQKYGNGKV
jgi:hypothetical protein